jgi:outer membrane autotransporter protein
MKSTKTFLASSIALATLASTAVALDITGPTGNTLNIDDLPPDVNVLSTGSIIVTGANTQGIVLRTGTYTGDINNAGIIQSDAQAIEINGTGTVFTGNINNDINALIDGGDAGFGVAGNGFGREAIAITGNATLSGVVTNNGELTGVHGIGIDSSSSLLGGIVNNAGGLIQGEIDALLLNGIFTGGITNSGTINTLAVNPDLTNTNFDGSAAISTSQGASFSGGIINNSTGVISGTGGIDIGNTAFTGNISNAGLITATGVNWGAVVVFSDEIDQSQATFNGAIINSGTIEHTATNTNNDDFASAISVEGVAITGGITNQLGGSITSNREAISIDAVNVGLGWITVVDGITNDGTITSTGAGAVVSHGSSITSGIMNTGIITGAEGIRVDGLYSEDIDGSTRNVFQNTNSGVTGGILNSGTITSTLTASQLTANPILVDDMAMYGAISIQYGATVDLITNTGTIESTGDAAGIVVGTPQDLTALGLSDPSLVNLPLTTVEQGMISGDLTNSGMISSVNNAAISVQNGIIGTITNNAGATISGGNRGILVSGSNSTVDAIVNHGTINGGGASAIAATVNGTIVSVANSGTIIGAVDFGSSGGDFVSTGGSSGEIIGATSISALNSGLGGITVTTINGDLTFSGQLTVDVSRTSSGVGARSQLNVTGSADVTGATVRVNVSGFDMFSSGDSFVFLTANSLTSDITSANGVDINDSSQVLSFDVIQSGDSLIAALDGIDFKPPLPPAKQGTKEGNNLNSVGDALNGVQNDSTLSGTNLGNAGNALINIDVTTTSGQDSYNKALASLDPEMVDATAIGALAADTAAAAMVSNRVTALRGEYGISGAVAGDAMSIHGFWIQLYGNATEQGERDGIDGFDADTYGVAAGFDAPLNERINAGLAFSYADTEVEGITEDNEMSIENYRFAGYASYNADTYYLDGQIAYAYNQYDTLRAIDPLLTPGQTLRAKGDHSGSQFSFRLRGGYPIAYENGLFVTPKVSLDYTFLGEQGYSESGAANLGLDISSEDVQVMVIGLGVKFAYPLTTANEVTWIPELSFDYLYDTIGDEVEVDSNFVGVSAAAFTTTGANAEQQAIKASLRLRAFGMGKVSVAVGVDFVDKDDYESQSATATVRYDF